MKLLLLPWLAPRESDPRREVLRIHVDRMVRLFREALSGGVSEDLVAAVRALALNGKDLQRGVVAGIELICVLVQSAERRHPNGQGRLKKEQVKAFIRYLLWAERFDIPEVPDYLEPFVIDALVDWSLDVVVLITNKNGLWNVAEEVSFSPRAWIWVTLRRIAHVTQPIWLRVVQVFAWIWERAHQWAALTPELKAALDEVVRSGLVKRKADSLRELPNAIVWIADHREQATAAVELVTEAAQIAEGFFDKTGAEKREYATDLVLATLEEAGVPVGNGIFAGFLQFLIGMGLDAAVNLFNKFPAHDPTFKHRTAP